MRIDVVDRARLESSMAESMFHGKVRPVSVFSRCGHVVCVAGEPVACYFGVYSCASVFGMFEFLNRQSTIRRKLGGKKIVNLLREPPHLRPHQ
jgi:hypothetical protein